MANEARTELDKFYTGLQTLPGLVGNLALSIAEAQRRLDQDYIESLAAFSKIVHEVIKDAPGQAEEYLTLFKAIAPSRYQFTETAVEVRADLQMASGKEIGIKAEVGIKHTVFAATVNVSYLKRSASDIQAAAVVRTTLNAIPAEPGTLDKLLVRGGNTPSVELKPENRYAALAEAFRELLPKPANG